MTRGDVSDETRLCLRPDVVVTVVENGAVLLDLDSKYFYSVNSSGWALVQLFEAGVARPAVAEQCRTWGASAEDEDHVERFIDVLVTDRLVQPDGVAGAAAAVTLKGEWTTPRIEKHKEPLQRVMTSAFDPTLPLAE
jgi:hypothetical protein